MTVTVSSATVAFDPLLNPPGTAEAEVTLTNNGTRTAEISTTGGNSGLFRALYNGTQEFATPLGSTSISADSINFSPQTSDLVAGNVSSIQAQFALELTAGDSAMGSGVFTVVPEPASVLLLGGVLALLAGWRPASHG